MRRTIMMILFSAIIFAILSAYDYLLVPEASPPPSFEISQTDFFVTDLTPGTHHLQTTIKNPSKEPRRLLGILEQCSGNACLSSAQDAPIIIPAGSSIELSCELEVNRSGPIDATINIYLEDNGIRTVTLHVTGNAVESHHVPKP